MRKRKVQRVRFHKGDKRPGNTRKGVYYKSAMVKKNGKILWRAIEMPRGLVLKESFFEEDIKKVVKFQNKNKTFGKFGFPTCFDIRSDEEIRSSQK